MKSIFSQQKALSISICLYWHCIVSSSSQIYSGSWCPYQVEKVVPCRVRNGTEPYYGPQICWKSLNGSYSCTKKILHRVKFVTTYKKLFETKYKCCPGFEGSDCQNECFNCSVYQDMIYKVDRLESRVNQLSSERKNALYPSQISKDENILHENLISSEDKSEIFIAINEKFENLMNEFKNMESRVRNLESEIFHLTRYVEEQVDPVPTIQNREHSQKSILVGSSSAPISTTTISTSNNRPALNQITKSTVARHLEDNLDRGDIASTLNDDYGEEIFFENSTEQYIDPLKN